jgi:hypothetical protein
MAGLGLIGSMAAGAAQGVFDNALKEIEINRKEGFERLKQQLNMDMNTANNQQKFDYDKDIQGMRNTQALALEKERAANNLANTKAQYDYNLKLNQAKQNKETKLTQGDINKATELAQKAYVELYVSDGIVNPDAPNMTAWIMDYRNKILGQNTGTSAGPLYNLDDEGVKDLASRFSQLSGDQLKSDIKNAQAMFGEDRVAAAIGLLQQQQASSQLAIATQANTPPPLKRNMRRSRDGCGVKELKVLVDETLSNRGYNAR